MNILLILTTILATSVRPWTIQIPGSPLMCQGSGGGKAHRLHHRR